MMHRLFIVCAILLVSHASAGNETVAQAQCDSLMDLIVVLDSSGSIGATEFQRARTAISEMVLSLNIAPRKIHFSLINYGSTVTVPITFRDVLVNNFTVQVLVRKILAIPYLSSGTATGSALREAQNVCKQYCRPLSEGVARSVVVFTDGQSNEGVPVKPEAQSLALVTKANVFAVGIGSGINQAELNSIASKPQYVLRLANYMQLTQVINNITMLACDMPVFVALNVKVESDVRPKAYRYYQMDTSALQRRSNGQGIFVSIEQAVHKGRTRLFSSTTDVNPKESQQRASAPRASIDASHQSYLEYVEPGASNFYFSILGVDSVNQYDFITHIFDLEGNTIG